jgi:rhamnulokinase
VQALAFDLGASSGRAVVGRLDDDKVVLQEIHRFPNIPVQAGKRLYWDILRLLAEMKQAILKTRHAGCRLQSMGIDSWGVDFGLLGRHGELWGNPYHYRDHQTDGMIEEVCRVVPREEIFRRTGIQFVSINTLNQLYAMKKAGSPLLEQADAFLMIPGLLRYFFTGEKSNDLTNSSTTQLLNIGTNDWDKELISLFGLPADIFGQLIQPGTVAGTLLPSVCEELGVPSFPVIAVGEHDTASAVFAVPTEEEHFAYLSCGTWSLLGTEVRQPVINKQALEWNFTNEVGVGSTYRLLKNIMGLWLIQECQRTWEKEGCALSFQQMMEMAERAKPFQAFIDPDHPMFVNPADMPRQVREYCREKGQYVPETKDEIIRCIVESLALKYRFVLERTEMLVQRVFPGLHLVGGGTNNRLLCQFTANAISRPVWAGPVEASVVGNLLVQFMALGQIKNGLEARRLVQRSFPLQTYLPQQTEAWNQAYERFCEITQTE